GRRTGGLPARGPDLRQQDPDLRPGPVDRRRAGAGASLRGDAVSQPVKAKGGAMTWVFALLLVILLLGAAAGGTLFFVLKQRTDQRLADQQAQIATLQKQ